MPVPDHQGIYLFVSFDWPRPVKDEHQAAAVKLHRIVQDSHWVREVLAASGGLGPGSPSVWVFRVPNYAALDHLLRDTDEPVCKAYTAFFSKMVAVTETVREEVVFR